MAYYQQVGRAGRATERADVILLPGTEDRDIWAYFASASMPRRDQAEAVLSTLAAADGAALSTPALEAAADTRRTRLELLLKVLDVDGAVQRVSGGWVATGQPWVYDTARYERVAAARRREQDLMVGYENSTVCRMRVLQEALDDPTAADCGRCDICAGPWFATELPPGAVRLAAATLARVGVELEPRVQWPTGMDRFGIPVRGRIPPDSRAETGRALARLTDLGWGGRLRELLRSPDAPTPEPVLTAVVDVLRSWPWAQRPVAVVSMPSRTRPALVRSIASGVASIGRLPYAGELSLVEGGPTGEPGGSSAFRLAGVWGRLDVGAELRAALADLRGPVLLVDDLAASRWTLAVAARALREAGAAGVLPLVLAVEA